MVPAHDILRLGKGRNKQIYFEKHRLVLPRLHVRRGFQMSDQDPQKETGCHFTRARTHTQEYLWSYLFVLAEYCRQVPLEESG